MKMPEQQPTLETERLRLRPLIITDAPYVQEYAGDAKVALMTSQIPHPYPARAAEQWIEGKHEGDGLPFAIALRESDKMIGAIGVHPESNGLIAEIGFWIGKPFWGQGYCTEAAWEILRYCFEDLELPRVFAGHFVGNDASGRVQEKIGMRKEGLQRWGRSRFGELKDCVLYGIIRPDWEEQRVIRASLSQQRSVPKSAAS